MIINNFNENECQWQGQVESDIHQAITNGGYCAISRHFLELEWTDNLHMVHSPSSRIDQMDSNETANFILAIGLANFWLEDHQYAENFLANEVTGKDLSELDDQILKEELGIGNENHIKCLIEIIKTATNQGKIARSADMGPNDDSTARNETIYCHPL